MNYQDLNDYELLHYVSENIEEANDIVMNKYYPLVATIVKKMEKYIDNCGIDRNDLLQEGMLGLSHAIDTYSEHEDTIFYTYAKNCIERRIITAIISAHRKKHKILNDSLSYDDPVIVNDRLLKDNNDPLNIIIATDTEAKLEAKVRAKLTELETDVFELMLAGCSNKEMTVILNMDYKQVDNAIQRIRNKAKTIFDKK